MTTTLTADADDAGVRLDVFLASKLTGITRSAAAKILADGGVTRSDRQVAKNYRVECGDVFYVILPEPVAAEAEAQVIALDVIYEDGDVVVVNKPRGMVVHPAPGHADGTLVNALLHHCGGTLSGIGGVLRPGIVHRLDRDTSGLIIAAKNDFAHASLSAQLKDRTLGRTYEAVVRGSLPDDAGIIDAPIGRHPTHRKKQAVTTKNSRPAVTRYEVIARYPGFTHVRCKLETGRTHQIRVHMAHIGHPVTGDALYGGRDARIKLDGQCLHARELRFTHPRTGETVELSAELPAYFTDVLDYLRRGSV